MKIGIIGSGHVGSALGRGWAMAGHDVVYGMRSHDVAPPYQGARRASIRDAAQAADVVLLATPWTAIESVLAETGDLHGKPLIDATNPIGAGFALALGHTTSGAERLAALAPHAHVVKAFNTTGFENMANPRYGDRRVMMPLAGDDPAAVAIASRLATDIGFEPVSFPALSRARDLEPLALLWIKLATQWGQGRNVAFGIGRHTADEHAPPVPPSSRPRTITVVGSGNIGAPLARAWCRAGHTVRIATRDPTSTEVAGLVAAGATAVPVVGSAAGADVVVFAIPAGAVVEVAKTLGDLTGKIVVDCTNAIGKGFTLLYGHTTSSSEEIAKALPGAHVVRAFNQQGAETLEHPWLGGHAAASFVASDDDAARATVRALANDVGLEGVEAGPLSTARYLEPMTVLWVAMSQVLGTRAFAISLLRRA